MPIRRICPSHTYTHAIACLLAQAARLQPEAGLPTALLAGAKGLVVMSLIKLGAGWSATYGTVNLEKRSRLPAGRCEGVGVRWRLVCSLQRGCLWLGLGLPSGGRAHRPAAGAADGGGGEQWGLQCSLPSNNPDLLCPATGNQGEVRAFNGAVHVGLGGNVSVAAGPLGRHADATLMVRFGA
eukprot:646639-Pelagomonas_calceolata.AAC.3